MMETNRRSFLKKASVAIAGAVAAAHGFNPVKNVVASEVRKKQSVGLIQTPRHDNNDLADMILNISPTETPLMSLSEKNRKGLEENIFMETSLLSLLKEKGK
jgi:hypothetical protein